jgi:hypothetical protein
MTYSEEDLSMLTFMNLCPYNLYSGHCHCHCVHNEAVDVSVDSDGRPAQLSGMGRGMIPTVRKD